ncbi:hypothetical protein C8R47DRAFT_1100418 [Mycena vitilis]|nr:hypothetical protein C8R47DRAFT_1100418 [Mycena vitilis]
MSVLELPATDATYFATGSTRHGLTALSNRIKSRLALRRLYFSPNPDANKTPPNDDEEDSEDEDRSSDSESSSSDAAPKPATTAFSRRRSSNLYHWNRPGPRVTLMDLPLEIIEYIAEKIGDPKCPQLMDAAAFYISEKYSDFSEARFALSALSQVSVDLRHAVERILYRNIQLDFTGWKGRKHTGWPAGSLRLLLRTLEERPELGRFIHVAALDYQLSSTDSEALEQGLEEFLLRTPKLTHLFLSQCPVALWGLPAKHLTGFATTFAPGILLSLLEHLPALQDLHLRDCHVMALVGDLPSHNLRRLRLDSSHEYASAHFARVLTICGASVHDLDVRFIGGLQLPAPCFLAEAPFPHMGGGAVSTLRLDNISVLSHLSSGYAHLLRDLPALEHLHVSHHAPFAPGAFRMLPASLRSLTASEYYGLWSPEPAKKGFVAALAACISISTKEVARVEGSSGRKLDERWDLLPVVEVCRTDRILCEEIVDPYHFVTIFCTSSISSFFVPVLTGVLQVGPKVVCENDEEGPEGEDKENDEDAGDADDEASFQDVIAAIPTRLQRLNPRDSPDDDVFT